MKKKTLYTELSYFLGLVILAFSAALMEHANFGMSMVVAPAYILHVKLSQFIPFFSFGMAEYTLQAVLIIILSIVLRRFKRCYLLSFVTAVLYGFTLDAAIAVVSFLPDGIFAARVAYFIFGLFFCAVCVSFFFHTYISPEAYELFVKELSAKLKININKVKTVYDCTSCVVAIVMSFAFFGFGHFEGVGVGTVICALVNGFLIGGISRFLESRFDFKDGFRLRGFFEK